MPELGATVGALWRIEGALAHDRAKRRAIDGWRRRDRLDERYRSTARQWTEADEEGWEPIDDDVLRLAFTACHPVFTREAQVTL
ncbi:MAG: hypothetical protein ABIS84_09305, partial [Arachnia sp.]